MLVGGTKLLLESPVAQGSDLFISLLQSMVALLGASGRGTKVRDDIVMLCCLMIHAVLRLLCMMHVCVVWCGVVGGVWCVVWCDGAVGFE
jgi:hypothetical protein